MLRSARSIVVVTGLAGVMNGSGCIEVNAPPPQDLQGTGFDVVDGKVTVDTSTVPVVAECAEGQTIVRTATGWSCISPPDASKIPVVDSCADGEAVVRVGDGWGCAPVDGNGVVTVDDACDPGEAVVATSDGWGCAPVDDIVKVQSAQCSDGDVLVREDGGWDCVAPPTFGAGLTTVFGNVSVNFSEVASFQRIRDAEDDIGDLNRQTTVLRDIDVSLEDSIQTLNNQFDALTDDFDELSRNQFIGPGECSEDTEGGLSFDTATKTLRLCVDSTFRAVELVETETFPLVYLALPPENAPPGPPSPETSGQWPSTSGGAAFFLGSDVGRDNVGGFDGFRRISAAAGGGAIGQRRLRLPASNFSIEVFFSGSDTVFSHGEGLEVRLQASELSVREFGRETRYQIQNLDTTQPNQVVYVHTATNERQVFVNGRQLVRGNDATVWRGPYLGEEAVFTLGNRFGGVNSGTYHQVTFLNRALTNTGPTEEVRTRCKDFFFNNQSRCNPPL
jgi:hypothetical protein